MSQTSDRDRATAREIAGMHECRGATGCRVCALYDRIAAALAAERERGLWDGRLAIGGLGLTPTQLDVADRIWSELREAGSWTAYLEIRALGAAHEDKKEADHA